MDEKQRFHNHHQGLRSHKKKQTNEALATVGMDSAGVNNCDDIFKDVLEEIDGLLQNVETAETGNDQTPDENIGASDNTEKLQQLRRERTPWFYCRWVAEKPKLIFFSTLFLMLMVSLVPTVTLFAVGYDIFPFYFDNIPLELYTIPYKLRAMTFKHRNDYDSKVTRFINDSAIVDWERGLYSNIASLDLYYKTNKGNIFTKSNLQKIKKIEDDLITSKGYKDKYCQTKNSRLECFPVRSVIRYFDGSFRHINPIFYDPKFENINGVILEAFRNPKTSKNFKFFLPKKFTLTPFIAKAEYTRSIILFGCSLTLHYDCSEKSVIDNTRNIFNGDLETKLDRYMSNSDTFEFFYYSYVAWTEELFDQGTQDMYLTIGSFLFIFGFLVFHTRSLWVSSFAILGITISFITANVVYRTVLQFTYIGFFHVLAIFIVLGIGADDLFVFFDAWRLTALHDYPSLSHRLSDAYSRSIQSMFFTSLTTMVAFLSCAISPLLATRSFGIFAALAVMLNYMTVVVFFPTVVVMYHLYFENFTWPFFKICNQAYKSKKESKPIHVLALPPIGKKLNGAVTENGHVRNGFYTPLHKTVVQNGHGAEIMYVENDFYEVERKTTSVRQKTAKLNECNGVTKCVEPKGQDENWSVRRTRLKLEPNIVVRFFRDHYYKFVTHSHAKKIYLGAFLLIILAFIIQASKLGPETENLRIWNNDHHLSKGLDMEQNGFLQRPFDNMVKLIVVWGLALNDRTGCKMSDIECEGKVVFDDNFDPNPVENQIALIKFCDNLYNLSREEIKTMEIQTNKQGEPEVFCFTKPLQKFLHERGKVLGLDLDLPWDWNKVNSVMMAESQHFDISKFSPAFTSYLDIAIQYWLYNGYNLNLTTDYIVFNSLIGEELGPWSQSLKTNPGIYYGNKLKYIAVAINTSINFETLGYTEGIGKVERWESFVANMMKKMPMGLRNGYHFNLQFTWHWLHVQKELEKNALVGIGIGLSLALPILCIATMNLIIGFLATLSICCTTVCVIGVIPTAGWKFGLLVSLNMTMLVGLAVDYVVHLAEGYKNSLHRDRKNRTRDMLEDMGTSVLAGASTTLGASSFMLFSGLRFYLQFGTFLFCTIGFSLCFSLGLFTVLISILGPENDQGSIRHIVGNLMSKFKRKKDDKLTDV